MSYGLTPSSGAPDFRQLFLLRGLVFCGQAGAVVFAGVWLNAALPWPALVATVIALTVTNAILWRMLKWRAQPAFLAQLWGDVAALAALLYCAGGATNPFVWLLLFQLTIAATVLPAVHTWLMALAVTAAYTVLMWFYRPLPGVHLSAVSGFGIHIVGMWIGFILSAVLLAYFLSRMATAVRASDRSLALAREQALRDEQLISLGTLAASAAHELGTPLGTLAVLSDELAADVDEQAEDAAHRKLALMNAQIGRCEEAIAGIVSSAGVDAAQGGYPQDVAAFLEATVSGWQQRRTGLEVCCEMNGVAPGPRFVAERSLASALSNIFDNAADASPNDVKIQADWNESRLSVRVFDRGRGCASDWSSRVGKTLFSDKTGGHGLGLYLSHGIIQRLGGRLSIHSRSGGGTAVEVELPLAGLIV
jgi:two-component system sensor histidine kinase RegB